MLKRKISFVTYTIIITALILVVGISCLLVIQNNLMKDDMNLMAYKKLIQEVAQIRRYIVYDSQKKPHIDDGLYDREDDPDSNEQIYVFLQGNDGEILDGEVFTDKYAFAFKKGNTELEEKVNKVLQKLIDEGKVDEFTLKHTTGANADADSKAE